MDRLRSPSVSITPVVWNVQSIPESLVVSINPAFPVNSVSISDQQIVQSRFGT